MQNKNLTPQTTYDAGKKLHKLTLQQQNSVSTKNFPGLGLASGFGLGIAGIYSVPALMKHATFIPEMPNHARNKWIEIEQNKLQMFGNAKSDSMLIQDATGHISMISVAQKKLESQKKITFLSTEPKTIKNPVIEMGLAMMPSLVLIGFLYYKANVLPRLISKRKEKLLNENMLEPMGIYSDFDDEKNLVTKINAFAKENNLPEYVPAERKKILGIF